MTDDQHADRYGEGTPQGGGRWDPLPQGDYDDGATAFVKLPEGGIDALLASSDSPLAAPGHGYVPPPITVTPATTAGTDPAATGTWSMPAGGVQWPDPNAVPQQDAAHDQFTYEPGATGQWAYETYDETAGTAGTTGAAGTGETAPVPPAPGHDVTGQWSIPVAGGDLPDESGEFTTSALVEQWGGTPPATLPGGAPAPWATHGAGQPWAQQATAGDGGTPAHGTYAGHLPQTGAPAAHEPTDPAGPPQSAAEAVSGPAEAPGATEGAGTATEGSTGAENAAEGPAEASPEDGYAPQGQPGPEPGHEQHAEEQPGYAAQGEQPDYAAQGEDQAGTETGYAPQGEDQPRAESGHAPHADGRPEPQNAGQAPDAEAASATRPEAQPQPQPTAGDGVPAGDAPSSPSEGAAPDAEAGAPAEQDQAAATSEPDPARDTASAPAEEPPAPPADEHPLASYVLRVNGSDRPVTDAWIGESLLYVLRERLGLAGAKDGCSQGECGACNVQVDGRLVASCLVPAVTAAGSEVRTVEGLAVDGQPSDVQRALARCGAVQCGFCVPGMAMTVHDLLEGNPAPTELETRQALCGNLCRCSGYRGVVEAVKEVVAERDAHAAAEAAEPAEAAEHGAGDARIPHQAGPGAGSVNPSAFEPFGSHGQPHQQAHQPHHPPYGQGQGQDGGQA
ncbi:2Fe-2S iron-sulfur cluster-binding protein [Streptomyces sp. NPDC052773]|uniref:2Fe-2S iron-sulfur cluster-binding protein n=1 Tax=Streptomyces sp. NPDC052773 TaxID=3365693 RepID=UPI0037D774F0